MPSETFFVEYETSSNIFEINRNIKNLINKKKIDILIVTSFYFINPKLLNSIQGKVFRVKIDGDDLALFNVYSKYYCNLYDLNITNTPDICEKFKKLGANSFVYASPAVNNFTSKNEFFSEKQEIDVSFIGLLRNERNNKINFLKKNNINIKVYGDNSHTKFLSQNNYFETIKNSKINLNFCSLTHNPEDIFSKKEEINKLKNIPGRIFEILSCKSFLLTENNSSLEYFFEPGKDFEVFNNNDELLDKIKFYLSNKNARDKISKNGFNTFLKKYEYKSYMPKFIDTISSFEDKKIENKLEKCPKIVRKFFTKKYISLRSFFDVDFYFQFHQCFDFSLLTKKIFKKLFKI